MAVQWAEFVNRVRKQLETGDDMYRYHGQKPFDDEYALTRAVALSLRDHFSQSFGVPADSRQIHHHVVYRDGDKPEDRLAWKAAKPYKWVVVQGLRFVPDVLVRRTLDSADNVLPIEVKLVKGRACSQSIATAIGQCLAYGVQYPQSILFVGVKHGAMHGKSGLATLTAQTREDKALRRTLADKGISVIFRDVDV